MVLQRIEHFSEAPFTLQRLCELVLMPDKYYKDTNKYIHALLKCLLVVSGIFLLVLNTQLSGEDFLKGF